MIIVAAGDSFVWGSELADSPHGAPNGYSRNTFPALLARDYTYKCVAYPGASNGDIVKQVRDAPIDQKTFVIVSWTWPSRHSKLTSDKEIIETQRYLEHLKCGYMFTCADNCVVTGTSKINWSKWFMFPPAAEEWLTITPRGFFQWAVENKYSTGQQQHPLEQAHIDAAKLMKDKFDELVKKHLESYTNGNSLS